ncbi:MAG: DUF2490 domain-containing protein [Flavobacteriales bacterium]|nr:DUF2490 domain-containing protein [Flavobacteriales bacterium]
MIRTLSTKPNNSIHFFLCCISCFLIGTVIQAQVATPSPTAIQSNAWVMYFGNHRLSDRWGIHSEYQWRRSNFVEDWQQSLARIGVDHYFASGPQVTAGYGWIKSYPYGDQPIATAFNEHRIWQQLILNNKAGRFHFNHRYRLEQRFLEQVTINTNGDAASDDFLFKQRVRYRLLVSIPINHKDMLDNTLFLALYAEPFLQFGKHVGTNIMDQNRLYAALGWRADQNFNVQLGYLNHYIPKSDGIRAENNHTAQLGITYNFDFRKQTDQ